MLFSSIIFLVCLPILLILYYILSFSRIAQNVTLLIFSLFFYAWGEPKFVLIMLLSIIVNYVFGFLVAGGGQKKSFFLSLSIFFNLSMLFVYKYLNFALDNLNASGFINIVVPRIALPLGISFFTFQAMSYVIDVYRGTSSTQKNLLYLALYIAFFPQLIAGPIVRYNTIEHQILHRKESVRKLSIGCTRFLTGLGKKILIANNMAIVADHIYAMTDIPASLSWLGSIAYTLQIFFDFSAYSDMAIGLGLMFGFEFLENFNYPYLSKSITEFWRRWHISLGEWFRDYVYFPLGGSRTDNKDKMVRNLLIVWLLTGIWHGAEWTFLIWGLMNFVFIAFEKLINFNHIKKYGLLKHIYALFIVNIGWVLFRAESLEQGGKYISAMLGTNGIWSDYTWMFFKEYLVFFIAGVLFSFPIAKRATYLLLHSNCRILKGVAFTAYPILILAMLCICISYLVKGSYNPFIYFNF